MDYFMICHLPDQVCLFKSNCILKPDLTNIKSNKTYHVVYLENEYVKISILPEIGGRLFSALDKTNNYDFIYKHSVVKPALIGLIGAWISGGIEWNIPHHHRASTFIPVQWSREENPDGSKTIWVGELEVRQRMRWAVGYTLYPGSSVLECKLYYNCGQWSDGIAVLQEFIKAAPDKLNVSPVVYYYLGFFAEKLGYGTEATEYRTQAALQSPDYVFPFQDEAINVLRSAIAAEPGDARALYYLGNLLYHWQPEASADLWEKSSTLDPTFPIIWRNLAIAYSHQKNKNSQAKAIACLEKAVASANPYSTHFVELDQLYKATNVPVEKRLAMLEKNQSIIIRNDEALGDLITLKIFAGKTDEAIKLLQGRTFSIWEGATPFNTGQAWLDAHFVRGLQLLKAGKYSEALVDFEAATNPPENLRAQQGSRAVLSSNIKISYWTGCAYDGLKDKVKARKSWNDAIAIKIQTFPADGGTSDGARKMSSDDNILYQGEQLYYQALAKKKLGNKEGNEVVFNELVTSAATSLNHPYNSGTDASSQFIISQSSPLNAALAHYIAGLGYTGLGNKAKAVEELNAALELSPDYLDAKIALEHL